MTIPLGFFLCVFFWLVFVSVRNYLLVSEHLNYFYFFVIMNIVAVNICVQVYC